ncbi:MAG: protein kinase [Polyangiaceae bacterium]
MQPGLLLDGRFKIVSLAASGGMGDVYRAEDTATGAAVAIKVMRAHATQRDRFLREMAVLETLDHPAIVRHLGHGEAPGAGGSSELWLAMEWIEGEELEARIAREGLTIEEALAVARSLASALEHAHTRGIVHRDLKPSNALLRGGDPRRATLLDFGVARVEGAEHALTQTGTVIGTVGYMAPEQASGGSVDARADVFALGCVLFECLTGAPPFSGATPIALLAKLLLAEPPRVRAARPSVPPALDDLVARMLARDPDARPAGAGAVLPELGALDAPTSLSVPPRSGAPGLTRAEQRVVSVVVAEIARDGDPDAPTLAAEEVHAVFSMLEDTSARYPSRVAPLGPTAAALVLEGRTSATDQAIQAAGVALSMLDAQRDLRVTVATGRAETTSAGPTGPMIERAIAMLDAFRAGRGAVIDDVTRALVEARFTVESVDGVHRLTGRRSGGRRLLLGKAIPCVGRDRELAVLEAALEESVEESVARAALVIGPPGIGKSRMVEDLVSRAAAQRPDLVRLVVRAEPLKTGAAFGLAGDLVAARAPRSAITWTRTGRASGSRPRRSRRSRGSGR